jgi:hypothetical protein
MKKIILLYAAALFSFLITPALSEELPDANEIKTISIKLNQVEFDATADDWKAIREQLLPSKQDPEPSKWIILGEVKIVRKNGEAYVVDLYHTKSDSGAFSAGKTYEDRIYYRGGNSDKLYQALLEAHKKSKNANKAQKDHSEKPSDSSESK